MTDDIEQKRAEVAAFDAAQAEARKAEVRAKLQPLVDIGLGGPGPLTVSAAEAAAAMRQNAAALAEVDANLPNLLFSTAQVLETANDRIRTLAMQNAPAPEAPAEPAA